MKPRLRVAIVAASLRILGGQAVQAARLIDRWRDDPRVDAWLVPINPLPPPAFRALLTIKYVRTVVTQLWYWPLLVRQLRRADVVHVFSASYTSFLLAPLPAIVIARLLGRPVILNYHSGEAPDHLRRSAIARYVLKHWTDLNVVPSPFLRRVLASFGIRAEVVPNTLDPRQFVYRARNPLRPRIVSTRNFEPIYNVPCVLRAFAHIQRRFDDASLTLVGAGSQDAALRRLAEELGLRNVSFTGPLSPSEIHRAYDAADIYLQAPTIDNMPLSVLEAFASGLPVVSTDVGGIPTILTHGLHGLLGPNDDDRTLAAHVMGLLETPERARNLAAAAHRTCAAYEWPIVREEWLARYRKALKSRDSAVVPTIGLRFMGRRLTAREIAWRLRVAGRTIRQRVSARLFTPSWNRRDIRKALAADVLTRPLRKAISRGDWLAVHEGLINVMRSRPACFPLNPASRDELRRQLLARWPDAAFDAAARADRILANRYDVLGYRQVPFASVERVNWHLDPIHQREAPHAFWADVRYLDPAVGDHKIIWELNRHQHWLQLGRAFWLTGDSKYADGIVGRLESWLAANPPLVGINWASMLEIAFRSISWAFALHFLIGIRDPGSGIRGEEVQGAEIQKPWLVDLLVGLDRQLTHLEQNLSHYFSPNTHLTGEALALYVTSLSLPELRASSRRVETGRRILLDEIDRQILADGGHAERSTHYQRYTLDFYLLALIAARQAGDHAAIPRFEDAVRRLAHFTRAMADDEGRLPLIGDDDGGMLWPIAGRECVDVRDSIALAAALVRDPALAPWGPAEEMLWLGVRPPDTPRRMGSDPGAVSRAFLQTGYVVLRDQDGGHAVFDVGAHGYLNAGHAHADALAVTLTLANRPFLIDPGTSTYTMDGRLRDLLRSSMSHNTVTIDDRPQAIPSGPFHWRTRADAELLHYRQRDAFEWAEASHDGYAPTDHHRTIVRTGDGWLIVDRINGDQPHAASAWWHFDPAWAISMDAPGRLRASHADGQTAWLLYDGGDMTLGCGDAETGMGWCAPIYGTLVPTWAARITRAGASPFAIVTWVGVAGHASSAPPILERLDSRGAGEALMVRVRAGARTTTFALQPGDVRVIQEIKEIPLVPTSCLAS